MGQDPTEGDINVVELMLICPGRGSFLIRDTLYDRNNRFSPEKTKKDEQCACIGGMIFNP